MKRWALLILAALGTAGFLALGVWQIERREWKLALIARVEERIHATPVALPGPAQWPALTRESAEYLRVTASGHFLGRETYVRALTELGSGYWVMAPFRTDDGFVVLVNRGFVRAAGRSDRAITPADSTSHPDPDANAHLDPNASIGHTTVVGLVRMTEPRGGFLRANVPAHDQWYSRDVPAIALARNLGRDSSGVAPYFIDAESPTGAGAMRPASSTGPARPISAASSTSSATTMHSMGTGAVTEPVAGLTVVTFRNSHLSYAFTWFALALMTAFFGLRLAGPRLFNAGTARPRA